MSVYGDIEINKVVGVGITVTNALSDVFVLTCYRKKEKTIHTIEFNLGKKVRDEVTPLKKGDIQHGTVVKMIPSKKYLGPDTHIDSNMIEEWIEKVSYFMDDDITLQYDVSEGMKNISSTVYKKRDPVELLRQMCSDNLIIKPIKFTRSDPFVETVLDTSSKVLGERVEKNRVANYGFIFAYDECPDPAYDSYCNFTNTVDGGVHIEAVEKALCNYLQKATKDILTDKEKEKVDILWNDVRTNFKLLVYLQTDGNVEFEGNVKKRIGSKTLYSVIYAGAVEEINKYFSANPDKLKAIVRVIKTNAKARVEANRVRVATTKEIMDPLKEIQMSNLIKCNSTGKNEYREIFIVEGKSARGAASGMRFPYWQAFYSVRGMTANPFHGTIADLMDPVKGNAELRELTTVFRCGIGPSFDIKKCWYKKIIIMVDADIDGSGIFASLCCFFVMCLPGLVEAGYVYRALPPLYKILDGTRKNEKGERVPNYKFVHNKEEYVDLYRSTVIKNYKISILKFGKEPIKKDVFKKFILDTAYYLRDLNFLGEHYKVSKFLIERIVSYFVWKFPNIDDDFEPGEFLANQKELTLFMSTMQKKFPEVKYDSESNTISGVADRHLASIEINNRFIKKCYHIMKIYKEYGYTLLVSDNGGPITEMSIGMFSEAYQKYVPVIDENKGGQRYKGLGEMSSEDLYNTTIDPNQRVLIQLTMKDMKKTIERFEVLFGVRKKDKLARKKMMSEYHINPDDLDN